MVGLLLRRLPASGRVFIACLDSNGRKSHATFTDDEATTLLLRVGFIFPRAQHLVGTLPISDFHSERLELSRDQEEHLKATLIGGALRDL